MPPYLTTILLFSVDLKPQSRIVKKMLDPLSLPCVLCFTSSAPFHRLFMRRPYIFDLHRLKDVLRDCFHPTPHYCSTQLRRGSRFRPVRLIIFLCLGFLGLLFTLYFRFSLSSLLECLPCHGTLYRIVCTCTHRNLRHESSSCFLPATLLCTTICRRCVSSHFSWGLSGGMCWS